MYVFLMLLDTPRERNLFTEVYERYQHFMIYLAQGILNDRALAEDATQEAFLTLTRYMDRIEDVSSAQTRNFLATLVKSRAIDILRKEKKYVTSDNSEEMMDLIASEEKDPLEQILKEAECDMIRQGLAMLSEEHRVALELKYVHDLKEREIADVLGLSEKTAGMRIYRGRLKLKEILEKQMQGRNRESEGNL